MSQSARTTLAGARHAQRPYPSDTIKFLELKVLKWYGMPTLRGPTELSGRVPHREGDGIQQGRHTVQERFDRAEARRSLHEETATTKDGREQSKLRR